MGQKRATGQPVAFVFNWENILYFLKIHILNYGKKNDLKITTIKEKHLIFQKNIILKILDFSNTRHVRSRLLVFRIESNRIWKCDPIHGANHHFWFGFWIESVSDRISYIIGHCTLPSFCALVTLARGKRIWDNRIFFWVQHHETSTFRMQMI